MDRNQLLPVAGAAAVAAPSIVPTLVAIAPPLIIGAAAIGLLAWLFSDDEDEAKAAPQVTPPPQTPATSAEWIAQDGPAQRALKEKWAREDRERAAQQLEFERRLAEATERDNARRAAAATSAHRAVTPPAPVVTAPRPAAPTPARPAVVATVPTQSPAAVVAMPANASTSAPFVRKLTLEKVAAVFASGPLPRKSAVAALISQGVKRSAAYAALSPIGPFAAHLQTQPSGALAWRQ